jgi:transposase
VATTDLVSDSLWEAIESLLPPEPRQDHGGPPRVSHRAALGGMLFILRHGLRWRDLPLELGFGSGVYLLAPPAPVAGPGRLAGRAPGSAQDQLCGVTRVCQMSSMAARTSRSSSAGMG